MRIHLTEWMPRPAAPSRRQGHQASTFRLKALVFGVTEVLAAAGAWGQTAESGASGDALEAVVVTAQRREQSLQDVPISVTAFTAEILQDRSIVATQDLQVIAPELKLTNNITTPTNLSLGLRGSTQQDASLMIAESPIGVYVDDVYVSRMNSNNVQYPDIDNIQFLHGPQGTLYGRNTLQGALTFNSRVPGKDSWLDVDGGGGDYEQYRGSFSGGMPFGESGWAGSVAGLYDHKNGEYFNRGTDSRWDSEENAGVRAKLHYYASEIFDFQVFSSYTHSLNQGLPLFAGTTPSDPGNAFQYNSNSVAPAYNRYTINAPAINYGVPTINSLPGGSVVQTISGIKASWKLPGVTLKSITGYVTTLDTFTSDYGGDDAATTPVLIGGEAMNVKEYTQELQALGKAFDDRLDYIGGLYYFRESGHQEFGWYGFGLGPLSTTEIRATTDSYAAYGQGTFNFTDSFSATAGLRWTEDKKNIDLAFQQLGVLGATDGLDGAYPNTAPLHYDLTFVAITPKFSLDYKLPTAGWADSALVYVSAGRGFKSGGVSGINIFDLSGSLVPYKSEENWTYEAGIKTEFFGHKLRVNADYFVADVTDLVLNETVANPTDPALQSFPEVNAGDTRVQGLELEVTAAPVTGLTVFLNPSFDTGKYTGVNPGSSVAQTTQAHALNSNGYSIADPIPPQLPWFAFSSGFDYAYGLPLTAYPEAKLLTGADWFKTAKYPLGAANDLIVSAYDRLNAYVGVAVNSRLQFRVVGKNVQNRETVSTGSRGLGGFYTLPPREITVNFSYKMGAER